MQRRWYTAVRLSPALAMVATACTGGTGGGGGTTKGEIIIASNQADIRRRCLGRVTSPERDPVRGRSKLARSRASSSPSRAGTTQWNGNHDPQKGAQNIQEMIADAKILGMVGPNNSNVARAQIPIANRASFVMISAANTNECLTQTFALLRGGHRDDAGEAPSDRSQQHFRIAAADTFQGPAAADYAVDTLKATKVAVWSDNETFGKGVADKFTRGTDEEGRHGRGPPGLRHEDDQRLEAVPHRRKEQGGAGHLRRRH